MNSRTVGTIVIASLVFLIVGSAIGIPMFSPDADSVMGVATTKTSPPVGGSTQKTQSTVSLSKLPLGDKKNTTSPKVGYVYTCRSTFESDKGGAGVQGFWINTTNGTWDATKKLTVDGSVAWKNASWKISSDGTTRLLVGNGLPLYHTTGVYPIASSDDAYQYDRNPNAIKTQMVKLSLPVSPTLLTTPECMGGEVGIMLSGIPIFTAFDAGGRDAMAWEIQDSCNGHPQVSGEYHYHGYSPCLKDPTATGTHSDLVGYALDGFGIYGLKGEHGVELATADLDECHGHTHTILWDGNRVSMYHYHLTRDFPYSVSCFRGKTVSKQVIQGPMQGGTHPTGGAMPSGMPTRGGNRPPPPFAEP